MRGRVVAVSVVCNESESGCFTVDIVGEQITIPIKVSVHVPGGSVCGLVVDERVAVVVDAVADFQCAGVDVGVAIVAIPFVSGVPVAVYIVFVDVDNVGVTGFVDQRFDQITSGKK